MTKRKLFATALFLALTFSLAIPLARADTWNQATQLTFSVPVAIPGQILPAGTYWFILADSQADRNIVQIFSEDRSVLYATVLAVSCQREDASDETTVTFAERPYSETMAIHAWFYPGDNVGHEFVYSR